ncbi:hypothetical protein AYO21_01430 [Fonsecaea monophora]|uniref:Uncharacterized protein n=1 Tax=Fonsecaea monophora TaxID=254056 RepID=A0A177FJF8_9EURO|nr:hypothetical protein AYO21_01430 [Fonsecaea monophora]OAG44434.1 hypothetical protein AYO21_01430 [Fonsecaea monophora]
MRLLRLFPYLSATVSFLLIARIALCQIHGPRFRFDNQGNGNVNQEDLPETPEQRQNDLHWGFHEALMLARLVAVTFNPCEPVYLRYFKPEEAVFVRNAFYTIANIPLDGPPPDPTDINQFISGFGQNQVNPKFDLLTISINDNSAIGRYDPMCSVMPGFQAYFEQRIDELGPPGFMSLCDYAFSHPSLADIENPPAWARDPTGAPEPGGIMLHELFHWTYLFEDIPQFEHFIALDEELIRVIDDWKGPFPPDGYGPFHAMLVNTLPMQPLVAFPSTNNADNYVYYALSKWWSFKCQRAFGPAVDEDDGYRRDYPRY